MNWDQLSGEWKQMQAQVKSKWAKLTDDDLQNLNAKKDMLIGKIQARYGILKDEAERQLDEWMTSLSLKGGHDELVEKSDKKHADGQSVDQPPQRRLPCMRRR
jgi:uncharacterized protein YjbJ (UPF0337 family)